MFQSLFTTDEVTDIVTLQVIKLLNAPVTSQTAIATLKNHPHYPSFASISDSFSLWKIDNGAFNASLDELRSYSLPRQSDIPRMDLYIHSAPKIA